MIFLFVQSQELPTQYPPQETPVIIDVTEAILITFFIIILIAYVSIVLGYSKKRSIYVSVKISFSLLIGCLIMVENFGQEWEIGRIKTITPYRAGIKDEIESVIGVKIGLRSVNITLEGKAMDNGPLAKEIINYNERFWWTWDQGRFGFGPYAGTIQQNLRDSQRKGLPTPILWIAEYFTIDGEGIRFGRFYRTSGWYCHIILWSAFATWIVANIFLQTVGRYAAYLTGILGILQLLVCFIRITVRNVNPLVIPFENGILKMRMGQHFWIAFTCGILCIILALVIIFMDLRYPNNLSTFLGIDPLDQYDEYVLRSGELENMKSKVKIDDAIEMRTNSSDNHSFKNNGMMIMKRRSTIKNAQKDLFRKPVPVQIEDYDDVTTYENQPPARPSTSTRKQHSNEQEKYKPPLPLKLKKMKMDL